MKLEGHVASMLEYWALEMVGAHYYNNRIVRVYVADIARWFCSCFNVAYSESYVYYIKKRRMYRTSEHTFTKPRQEELDAAEEALSALPRRIKGSGSVRNYVQRAGRILRDGRPGV